MPLADSKHSLFHSTLEVCQPTRFVQSVVYNNTRSSDRGRLSSDGSRICI